MIAWQYPLSTRAVSRTGSPRSSCVPCKPRYRACPPSSYIAISKLARVRVDAFSNTMPSTRPGRVAWTVPAVRMRRSSSARRISASRPPSGTSQKLRKSLPFFFTLWPVASIDLPRLREHAIEDFDCLVDLRFSDYQARHEGHDVTAGHGDQQPRGARPRDDVYRIALDDQPLQQPSPACAPRPGPPPLRQPQQRGAEMTAHLAAVIQEAQLVDRLLDVQRRGGRERIAAERRRVCPRLEAARDLFVGQHRADRHAARQALRQR